jgi:hypothetical protein
MENTFRWDVFISHSSRDKARVQRLAEALRTTGLEIWLDDWVIQPGDDIYAAIEDGLEHSRIQILCLSQPANESDWVKLERNTRLFQDPQNKERRFIPVLLEDCQMPATLRRLKHVDWRDEGETEMAKLIQACTPPKLQKPKIANRKNATQTQTAPPSGAMRVEDARYVERPADIEALASAKREAETIVITAPPQTGKSSLLKRYLSECQKMGKKTALIYLSHFQENELDDYPIFLTELARTIWRQCSQPSEASPITLRNQRELTNYIEDRLLATVPHPIVFAFDEVDHMLGRSWQSDFASTLRLWHERRADPLPNPWARLGLVLASSTEPYLFIKDSLRSPFNVGLQLELQLFGEKEYQKLARNYGVRLAPAELDRMIKLLGGQPYLTQLACYHLTRFDFAALDRNAARPDGPFGSHLRALEKKLEDAGLLEAMKQLASYGTQPGREDLYRLRGTGLVREANGRIAPANDLYKRFFGSLR